jgi:hypothetical protein
MPKQIITKMINFKDSSHFEMWFFSEAHLYDLLQKKS